MRAIPQVPGAEASSSYDNSEESTVALAAADAALRLHVHPLGDSLYVELVRCGAPGACGLGGKEEVVSAGRMSVEPRSLGEKRRGGAVAVPLKGAARHDDATVTNSNPNSQGSCQAR